MSRSILRRPSPSILIACLALFVALSSTGVAATGKAFILGKVNSANKTTALKSGSQLTLKVTNTGSGQAASFNTKPGEAPFTVNRQFKVTNLNADLLDGVSAAAFLQAGSASGGDLSGPFANLQLGAGVITSAEVLDDNQLGGGLGPSDLATNSVAQAEIATDGVGATEIQNDSIDAGEIVDFGLTNQDIGVLFAEVSAAASLDSSSGGVTATKIGAAGSGQYEVDFGRVITACTGVATIGSASTATSTGEINMADRAGNTEAVFVDTNDSTGAAADRPFRLVIVC